MKPVLARLLLVNSFALSLLILLVARSESGAET